LFAGLTKSLHSTDKETSKPIYRRAKDGEYYIKSESTGKKTILDERDVDFKGKGKVTSHGGADQSSLVHSMKNTSIKDPNFPSRKEYQKNHKSRLVGPHDVGHSKRGQYFASSQTRGFISG
jgi:hypothetical protein